MAFGVPKLLEYQSWLWLLEVSKLLEYQSWLWLLEYRSLLWRVNGGEKVKVLQSLGFDVECQSLLWLLEYRSSWSTKTPGVPKLALAFGVPKHLEYQSLLWLLGVSKLLECFGFWSTKACFGLEDERFVLSLAKASFGTPGASMGLGGTEKPKQALVLQVLWYSRSFHGVGRIEKN
ncbi:hypothetical protein WDW89_22765 [Deltaproteobacteria bacterium TL4]